MLIELIWMIWGLEDCGAQGWVLCSFTYIIRSHKTLPWLVVLILCVKWIQMFTTSMVVYQIVPSTWGTNLWPGIRQVDVLGSNTTRPYFIRRNGQYIFNINLLSTREPDLWSKILKRVNSLGFEPRKRQLNVLPIKIKHK